MSGRQGVWLVFAPQELVWLATALLEKDQHTVRDQAFESHAMRRNPPCWGSNGECPIALVVNLKRMTVWIRRPFVFKRQWGLSFPFYVLLRTRMFDPARDREIFCNATKSRKIRICSSFSELRTCSLAITSWLARDTRALRQANSLLSSPHISEVARDCTIFTRSFLLTARHSFTLKFWLSGLRQEWIESVSRSHQRTRLVS